MCRRDVSGPTVPVEAGFFDTPEAAEVVFIAHDYAYVASSDLGLWVVNTLRDADAVFVADHYARAEAIVDSSDAAEARMRTFWVTDKPRDEHPADWAGTLFDLKQLMGIIMPSDR
ncbi:MAG: hypothetical protein ACE5LU_08280 [Anaerolineae bacterium]